MMLASAIVAEIGDISRFMSADKLAKMQGLHQVKWAVAAEVKNVINDKGIGIEQDSVGASSKTSIYR